MANKGAILTAGQYLDIGDYLVAANAQYFAIMQIDGNFVIYQGSDPAHQGTPTWATNTNEANRQYMGYCAVMQSDGNFVLYRGTGTQPFQARWASNTYQAQGQYFALLRNDGHLVLYHGTPSTPGDPYWASQTGVVTTQLTILSGNNQTQPRLEPTPGTPAIANFGPLSVRLTYNIGDPLSGKPVTWSVSGHPANMIVQLASTTTTTDSNSNATLNSVQASYGDGTFTVVASYGSASVTFNLTVGGLLTTIFSGNNQSIARSRSTLVGGVAPGALFAPLQVKVVNAATGQPASGAEVGCYANNVPPGMVVQFYPDDSGGPAAVTDSNGIATFNQLNGYSMTAYNASGSFTVVCTPNGGNTVTFNETVSS
jgi:hypothetical protein